MKELTRIPFHDATIYTTADGAYVALRPICEALGLDFSSQRHRLKRKTWACVVIMTTQMPGDDQRRDVTFLDRRTFTMWLATIDTGRIKDERSRALIDTYQCEAADVLDKYFHEGFVVNPRTEAKELMELIALAKGAVSPDHLEAKARIILARAMGEAPQIEAQARPLYAQDFMIQQGATRDEVRRYSSVFGKEVKKAYKLAHAGQVPGKYPYETPEGQIRDVCAYTEADRPLMERVWREKFAHRLNHEN